MSSMLTQTCPVLYGVGAINEIGDKIKEFGGSKALCIYDKGVAGCGIGGRIVDIIKNSGLDACAFEEVMPEPPDTQVDAIYAEFKDAGIDVVVGIGGGSCIDTAKGVAFLFTNHVDSIRPYIETGVSSLTSHFPLIAVPTASGTGSEVTPVAVITDTSRDYKGGVAARATLAILDPELTKTAPPFVTATSGMDAFAHAAEAMSTRNFNPKSDCLGSVAINNIVNYLPRAVKDGSDMEAREKMSIAANFAGMAFSDALVHLGHGMAETIGAALHQPHGLCCALCIPVCMEYVGEYCPERIYPIADAMEIDYSDISDNGTQIGLRVADKIREILHECNIPSFEAREVAREDFVALAPEIKDNFHLGECIVPLNEEMVEKFTARAYDAYR